MQTQYRVYVFNHDNEHYPYKSIAVFNKQKEALISACNIIMLLTKDYKKQLYCFMEQKTMTFEIEFNGVHIYNGDVPWSLFITNAKLEKSIIGPITLDKKMMDLGSNQNN